MPATNLLVVKQLKLDLSNFRTLPQKNELQAVRAMISVNPDKFWALTESLLTDGYHPTENIIVLKNGKNEEDLIVKEGNRRIAALKLILGHIRRSNLMTPSHIETKVNELPREWKVENQKVPCAIYEQREAEVVDKIVSLAHGKGEKAGRDKWNAVARARHNRDKNGASEPALDLLEKYLENGKNLTAEQAARWGGVYPLTVLDEAIKRLALRLGAGSSRELTNNYPSKIKCRIEFENIIKDIGLEIFGFEAIRHKTEDYASTTYGIPASEENISSLSAPASKGSKNSASVSPRGEGKAGVNEREGKSGKAKSKAQSIDDPKAVIRALRKFNPRGNKREKLVTLLKEARRLKLKDHPHAFCFLLRSMFEISAKAYCQDHEASDGPKYLKQNCKDKTLVDILKEISSHLIENNTNRQMHRILHGAMVDLDKPSGFLSVTSMNQLVHNQHFSIKEADISALFGNIFPLLEEMNR